MPRGGFLGKVDKEFKKGRNDHNAQVEKCKKQIDRINELNGSKITYDRETVHVEVPNLATGGVQYFKWDWLTSTTDSNSSAVSAFKQILSALEAKNNEAQYNSLISKLDSSTKNALDVNIKKYNITVPQSLETLQPVDDVISLLQKYSISYDGPMVQIQSIDYTNWKIPLQNISTDDPMFGHTIRAYDAVRTSNQSSFNQNYKELDVNGLVILRNIPFVSHKESNPSSTAEQIAEFIKNSGIVLPIPEEYKGIPTKEVLKYYTAPVGDAVIEVHDTETARINVEVEKEMSNLNITEEDSTSSNKLGEKIKLNNGVEFEVKDILKGLSDKEFVNMALKRVEPNIAKLLKEEIVLKLAYDAQKGLTTKKDAGAIIYSFEEFDLSDSWLANNNLSIEEIKVKEVEITGGASYLD